MFEIFTFLTDIAINGTSILFTIFLLIIILSIFFSVYDFGLFIDSNITHFMYENESKDKAFKGAINDFFGYTSSVINVILPTFPNINSSLKLPAHLRGVIPSVPYPYFDLNRIPCNVAGIQIYYPDPLKVGACAAEKAAEKAAEAARAAARAAAAAARAVASFFCITEDSLILMSDGITKKVKDIQVGEYILNKYNKPQKIIAIDTSTPTQKTLIYGINNIKPFFTEGHSICTPNNKIQSINPEITLQENPEQINNIIKLEIGNKFYYKNKLTTIEQIITTTIPENTIVYDLVLEDCSERSYIANGITIESQESDYTLFPGASLIAIKLILNNIDKLSYINIKNDNIKELIKIDMNNMNFDTIINNIILNNKININKSKKIFNKNKNKFKNIYSNIENIIERYPNSDIYMVEVWDRYCLKLNIFDYTNIDVITL